MDYDCSDTTASVGIDSASTDTIAALLRGISGVSDTANGTLVASGSGSSVTYTRATTQSGTTAIQFVDATTPGTLSSFAVSPQEAVVQSDTFTVPRTLVDGDTLTVTIDSTVYSQTFLSDSDTTITNLASNLNNLPYLGASASGSMLTVFAETAGNAYTTGNLTLNHVSTGNQTIANIEGSKAIQSITFGADFVSNDQIDVTVNGTPTSTSFSTDHTTTLLNVATAISGVSGVTATASGTHALMVSTTVTGSNLLMGQIRVLNTTAPALIQANVAPVAQSDSYTIQYPLTTGTTVTGNINGTPVSQSFTTDNNTTFTLLAGKLEGAAAVNASFSGGSQTLVIEAKSPGNAYTSSISVSGDSVTPMVDTNNVMSGAQVETYTFARNLVSGEVLQVTLDGTGITQNFITDTTTTLAALATQIDALSSVNATPAGLSIVVTASVPGIPFTAGTLTIDMNVATATGTLNIPAQTQIEALVSPRNLVTGDVLGATVNGSGVTVSFSGSEAATLAQLASQIDALSGVTATSSGLTITVSAEVAGIPFTIGNLTLENTITDTTTVNNVSPVAQVDALNLPSFYSGDTASVSLNGTPLSVLFRNDTSTTISDIQSALDGVGPVTTSLSGGQLIVTANTPGTPFTLSTLDVANNQTATIIAVNVPAVQQIVDITTNDVFKKWTFRVTINGVNYDYLSQPLDDQTAIISGLASVITASGVTATANGTQLTLSANTPGIEFTYAVSALDITAPAITHGVATNEILKSGATTSTTLSIDEPGTIYLVLSGSVANIQSQINTLLLSGNAFLGINSAIADTLYSFTIPSGIADGNYGVVAVDSFGNVSGYHTTGITIDNTAPIVTITTIDNQTVSGTTLLVSGTTEPLLSVNIDAGSGATLITTMSNGDFSGSVNLPVNSTSTIMVTATDVAGNVGMSTIHVTQDSINPLFTITPSATITNQSNITFVGNTEANVDVGIV